MDIDWNIYNSINESASTVSLSTNAILLNADYHRVQILLLKQRFHETSIFEINENFT